MRYSLVNYVGTGSETDPFRPAGSDAFADWTAIDLRPDSSTAAGWAFLATPTPTTPSSLIFSLGDDLLDLSLANRLLLQSKLGVTLEAGRTLRRHIRDILTVHARTDGTRWRPLLPEWINGTRARAWRVRLGGEVIDELPVVEGGATISETFNTANSDTLGPVLTWTEVAGDWDIVSNKAQLQSGVSLRCGARAETQLDTVDHYAQVDTTPSASSVSDIGVAVRFAAAANTYYTMARQPTGDLKRIVKMDAGTGTLLASAAYADDNGTHTVYGSVNGSSLRLLIDGANELTVTDTAITTGRRTGISGVRLTVNTTDFDNFTAADLATAHALEGTTTATFGDAGILAVAKTLDGTTTASFGASAPVVVARDLAGAAAVTTGTTGELLAAWALDGTTAATFGAAGDLGVPVVLAGISTASFGASADLTLVGLVVLEGVTGLVFSAAGELVFRPIIFRPPTSDLTPPTSYDYRSHDPYTGVSTTKVGLALFRHFKRRAQGRNVYLLTDGTITETAPTDQTLVSKIWLGGHDNQVTSTEAAALTAAGYAVTTE